MAVHRNPRRRARRQHLTSEKRVTAAGIFLTENPNRQPHTAKLVGPCDPTGIGGHYFDPRETAYSALTVSTPSRDRLERRRGYTSYTI